MHGTHRPYAGPHGQFRQETSRKVLIVEDNHDVAETLRRLLELLGHEAAVARTGPDGVRLARALRPDVVLCDIGLPGLDGFGVAEALRHDPTTADALLVAITGYGSDPTRRRCREVGFDHYFTKPVDPDVVLELIAAAPRRTDAACPAC